MSDLLSKLDELLALQQKGTFLLRGFHLDRGEIAAIGECLDRSGATPEVAGCYRGVPVYFSSKLSSELVRKKARLGNHDGVVYSFVRFVVLD